MKPETQDRLRKLRDRKEILVSKHSEVWQRNVRRLPHIEDHENAHEILVVLLEEQSILLQEVLETFSEATERVSLAMERLCEELQNQLYYTTKRVDKT